jgi:hypothetical protein
VSEEWRATIVEVEARNPLTEPADVALEIATLITNDQRKHILLAVLTEMVKVARQRRTSDHG